MTIARVNSANAKSVPRLVNAPRKIRTRVLSAAEEPPPGGTHQSLERGLQVLETIAATGSLISLGEASRRTGLHRSE
ncbi:helix-turn-helix domain-containing protein [Bradyrhizobium murdochi]|uniref:helix-turn-helix domain-containing protein n=1 Tax=Bradyrhizobium murdochi TaxID=1038859 RepID=UPI000A0148D6